MTRLRINLISNYIGQGYVSVVGIVVLPLYLKFLGPEAFGLVGFYTLLETWLRLLDLGMAPALSRQMATIGSSDQSTDQTRRVLRSMETLFVILAGGLAVALFASSDYLATTWLDVQELDLDVVAHSIALMGLIVAVRLPFVLYWSAMVGLERQLQLNCIHIVFVTLRFPVSLIVLYAFEGSVIRYFEYQLGLTVLQMLTMRLVVCRYLPPKVRAVRFFYLEEVRPLFGFAIGLAYSAALGVVVANIDKLMFSRTLTLSEYGYFTLVASISLAIGMVALPVTQAILPRMSAFFAEGDDAALRALYGHATKFVAYMVFPVGLFISTYPEAVVFAWTGDRTAAAWCSEILPWFVLAHCVVAISGFQYHLQFAHGQLRLHLIFRTALAIVCVPTIVYLARNFGPAEVGIFWLVIRCMTLSLWVPYVHRCFAPGLHTKWVATNLLPPAAVCIIVWAAGQALGDIALTERGSVIWEAGLKASSFSLILLICYAAHLRIDGYIRRNRKIAPT